MEKVVSAWRPSSEARRSCTVRAHGPGNPRRGAGASMTDDELNEALAELVRQGLVEVLINEDGERVFRLREVRDE